MTYHPHDDDEFFKRGVYVIFTRNYDGTSFRWFVTSVKELHQIMAEECADYHIDPTQDRRAVLTTMLTDEEPK